MKICWWTYYPTVNHTALVTALRARGVDVEVCYFMHYDSYRLQMTGWREHRFESWEHLCSSLSDARKNVPDFEQRVQMLPGYSKLLFWQIIFWCVRTNRLWFAMCEGSRGRWMTRPLVKAFASCVNRWALRMFALGERALLQYRAAGVAEMKSLWFGYAMSSEWYEESCRVVSPSQGCRFVYAGALIDRKAVDVLAEAWRIVSHEVKSIELRVIGEGPLHGCFEGLSRVTLCGAVSPAEIREAIGWGDVIILPSRYDAWGVALVEGAAQGLAMIASETTGASELIVEQGDGANGIRVVAGDVTSLAAALRIYANDPLRARREGCAARFAAKRLSAEALAETMEKELGKCLSPRVFESSSL